MAEFLLGLRDVLYLLFSIFQNVFVSCQDFFKISHK